MLHQIKDLFYFTIYSLFYRFSGAHNKPTSDSKYDPTIEHKNRLWYKIVRWYENREFLNRFGYQARQVNQPLITVPLPEISNPQGFNRHFFQYMTQGKTKPIVMRGLIKECSAVKKWNPDFFINNYGETELLTLGKTKNQKSDAYTSFTQRAECRYIKIKDSIENMRNNNQKLYINNVTEIFMKHPELVNDLNIDIIKNIDQSVNSQSWLKMNLFLGGPGTGSSLHCAVAGNFFFNIYGKKKWILIDSKYAKYFKMTPSKHFGFVISGYDLEDLEQIQTFNGLIPMYEVILEPGDCLFVPPWVLHYVKNETDFTIGVAVRDHTVYWQSWKNNWIFMLMSPYWWKLHPLFLKFANWFKGRDHLVNISMQSDKHILHHLAGESAS